MTNKPSHRALIGQDRGEGDAKKTFWTEIGAAWPTKDGKGLSVKLAAVPTDGQFILKLDEPKADEAA